MRNAILLLFAVLLGGAAAGPAHAEWWEARTDHFIVFSQSSEKDARAFAEKLERFDHSLRSLQRMERDEHLSDSHRVTIFRSGKQEEIAILAGAPGSGIAGFYIPLASGPVAFAPARDAIGKRDQLDAYSILLHEYAHHFMFRHFPAAYPSWYVEGLAETYSTIDLKDDGSFHLGNPPQSRAEALFGFFNYSIRRMLLRSSEPDFEDSVGRYSHGWLLTHFLTFEPSRAGQLEQYLKLINGRMEPAAAAEQAFGDLDKLEKEVNRYKRKRLPGALVRPANFSRPSVTMRRLRADEEAIMRVRMRSKVGVSRKTAKDVYGDARAIAAKHPGSFAVQLALTEAALDAEQFDEAERAADAALAIKRRSAEALILKGRIHLERGKTDSKHYATARKWLAEAHRADPGNPMPLFYNYQTYLGTGQPIPESAILGLERAYTLAPYDDDLRIAVVRQVLSEKKAGLSRDLLLPLALSPHESKRAKALSEVIALIDAGKLEDAIRKLDARLAEEEQERRQLAGRL